MSDWLLFTIVFGSILVANLISLMFIYIFRKEVIPQDKGRKAFFIIWMCLCGFLYWITAGIGKVIDLIHKN